MESIDYWRFCNELSLVQAALRIIGLDPSSYMDSVGRWQLEEQPSGYIAVLTALQNDIRFHWLKSDVIRIELPYGESGDIDWTRACLPVSDLKDWLKERGVSTGFFFPQGPVTADYLKREDPDFSSKLARAVEAWKTVRADRQRKASGRSVKADLTRWLNLHASALGLQTIRANQTNFAIEEVSRVAN